MLEIYDVISLWLGRVIVGLGILYVLYTFFIEFLLRHIVVSVQYWRFYMQIEKVHGKGTAIRPAFIRKYPKTYKLRVFMLRILDWKQVYRIGFSTKVDSPYGYISYYSYVPSFVVKGKFVNERK